MKPGAGLGAYSSPLRAPRAVHVHPFEVTPPFFLKLFLALLCQPLQFPLGLWVTYTPMPCSDLWEAKGVIWVPLMPRCHNLPLPSSLRHIWGLSFLCCSCKARHQSLLYLHWPWFVRSSYIPLPSSTGIGGGGHKTTFSPPPSSIPSLRVHFRPSLGLLNLGTVSTWGQLTLCCGAALCTVGCLAPPLTSSHWIQVSSIQL